MRCISGSGRTEPGRTDVSVELAMFPLGTTLVPYQLLPLRVFEPRYRRLVDDCLAGDRRFGVVLIERGSEVGGGDVRFRVGTVGRILDVAELPDGNVGLAVTGTERFRVTRWLDDDPYPRAEVVLLDDAAGDADGAAEAGRDGAVRAGFERVVDAARALGSEIPPGLGLADDPARAAWEAVAMAPIGPLDVVAILGEDEPGRRADRIVAALADAAELLELRRT